MNQENFFQSRHFLSIQERLLGLSQYESTAYIFLMQVWKKFSNDGIIKNEALKYEYFFNQEIDSKKLKQIITLLAKEFNVFQLFLEQITQLDKLDVKALGHIYFALHFDNLKNVNDAFFHYGSGKEKPVSHQVVELGVKLLGNSTESIYAPFANDFTIADYTDKKIYVEGEAKSNSLVCELIKIIDEKDIVYNVSNPLVAPTYREEKASHLLKQFDTVIAFPPFNQKTKMDLSDDSYNRFKIQRGTNLNIAHFEHILAQTKKKAVVLMPVGFTYRAGADEEFRKYLIEQNWLEGIIQLPTNIDTGSSIETTYIVINKQKDDKNVLFVSLKDDQFIERNGRKVEFKDIDSIIRLYEERKSLESVTALVANDTIASQSYSCVVDRYIISEEAISLQTQLSGYKLVELQSIADVRRSQLFQDEDEENGLDVIEIGPSDVARAGMTVPTGKTKRLYKQLNKLETYALQSHDIVLSTKGTIGKVGIVLCNYTHVIASQAMQVIRLKNDKHFNAIELYMYLKSDLAQSMLKQLVAGVAMPQISTTDIKKLKVPLLSKEELIQLNEKFHEEIDYYKKIEEIEHKIKKIHSDFLGKK
ncbi:N-6 DNA methylase [Sulfurimonas sp. HSL-1656]|uniref:N-6 DNA methylase n=1 Tax=Thiomicrolovo subterrani TaxID=3131934 RepID=UPI0031F7D747